MSGHWGPLVNSWGPRGDPCRRRCKMRGENGARRASGPGVLSWTMQNARQKWGAAQVAPGVGPSVGRPVGRSVVVVGRSGHRSVDRSSSFAAGDLLVGRSVGRRSVRRRRSSPWISRSFLRRSGIEVPSFNGQKGAVDMMGAAMMRGPPRCTESRVSSPASCS